MKRVMRLTAICLLLVLALSQGALAASAVLERATQIIAKMETNGNYGSVANDTNGSPSVGILQWNNGRAVNLLKKIIADDAEAARELLGDAMFQQLSEGKSGVWSGKSLSSAQKKAVGALLKTDAGVKRQNAQAESDITAYISTAKKLGIADPNALVYYADIAHQVGTGAVKKYGVKAAEIAGSYAKVTLKDLYKAALVYATYTKSRRTKVYNLLVENPVEGTGAETPVLPETVELNKSGTQTLYLGDTLKLSADVSPSGATAQYTWASSQTGIATVSDGVVTPRKAGTATIAVKTQNGKTDTVKITVKPVLVKSVQITGNTKMRRGTKQALKTACDPSDATNQKVRWRSSNSRIVAVNSKGVVLARRKGKATIYCMTRDGTKKIAKFTIKVG